ncbi:MAG TPA: NUDIX hydrolase [Chthoniobacterales bacterium]|nr:NUDIX hydrolase [Chthoniobacterales bacterium]
MKGKKLVGDRDGWETISSETHFANEHLEVATEKVRTPAKKEVRSWVVVHRKTAVIVAPMTADGKLLMIKQERVPIRSAIWEMPAGQIDNGESDEDAIKKIALKELREETGHELAPGGELIPLGHYFSSPGFTDEYGYLFFARPVQPCPDGADQDETESILDCNAFTVSEIREMIKRNEIRDANTLGICARLAAFGCISLDAH